MINCCHFEDNDASRIGKCSRMFAKRLLKMNAQTIEIRESAGRILASAIFRGLSRVIDLKPPHSFSEIDSQRLFAD